MRIYGRSDLLIKSLLCILTFTISVFAPVIIFWAGTFFNQLASGIILGAVVLWFGMKITTKLLSTIN